ncbi:tripartite motif-containing protein 3-like [Saccostrea cucullata]|uniref:tripartite motif-containing protein 3-like n=1 Tax=Saccostrea cuccullata TaxID=36930 RepID=UPI002ED3BFC9
MEPKEEAEVSTPLTNGVDHSEDHSENSTPETQEKKVCDPIAECFICKNIYNLPKVLPCFHSFCCQCLEDHISKSLNQNGQRHFACPVCEEKCEIPSGALPGQYAHGFQDDLFLTKLVELQSAMCEGKECDICDRREEKTPASHWCMDCNDALCDICLKVHLHGKTTAGHSCLAIAEMRKIPLESLMKQKNKVPCSKHNELITLFCVDCREPLCVQCMAVSHRRCENVITVADALTSRADVNDVVTRLHKLQMAVENVGGIGQPDRTLESSIHEAQERVNTVCDSICNRVRQYQSSLIKNLQLQAEKAKGLLQDRIEPRKSGLKSIKAANDRMQTILRYGSDVEILLAYNQVRKKLDSCQGAIGNTEQKAPSVRIEFVLDETVERFIESFERLGDLIVDEGDSDEGINSWGVTCTSSDDIIVTDCKNKRIQKFSKFGDLVDYVQLEDEPRDITTCGNRDDVAITMIGKLVIFLATRKTMQLIKRAKTERQYDGISYSEKDAFLIVSSVRDQIVDIIHLDGSILRSFGGGAGDRVLFNEPRYVSATPDRTVIISDVGQNAVICMDHNGRVVFRYKPDGPNSLKKPQGACVDKIGNLFVADFGNNRVQLLASDGTFQRHVLGIESALEKPVAIRVSGSNRMVIVQSDGMVKVFSYS